MASGKMVINSNEISSAVSLLSSSCSNLESNVSSLLPGNFTILSDLGLYSEGITSMISAINALADAHRSLISQINSHLNDLANKEDQLASALESGTGNYKNSGGSYGGEAVDVEEIVVDETEQGKGINTESLINTISLFNDYQVSQVLQLIDTYKKEGITLADMLFDTSLSSSLYVLLKNILGDTTNDLNNVTMDDYIKVQKTLLDVVFNSNVSISDLNTNSLISAKEYLKKISSENGVTVGELLLDSKYKNVLSDSLLNLYDGNEISKYGLSDSAINSFRNYVDNVASSNGISSENLIINNVSLLV